MKLITLQRLLTLLLILIKGLVVCAQAGYFLAHLVGRWISDLPIALIEIHVGIHILIVSAIYAYWWNKRLDVNEPITLEIGPLRLNIVVKKSLEALTLDNDKSALAISTVKYAEERQEQSAVNSTVPEDICWTTFSWALWPPGTGLVTVDRRLMMFWPQVPRSARPGIWPELAVKMIIYSSARYRSGLGLARSGTGTEKTDNRNTSEYQSDRGCSRCTRKGPSSQFFTLPKLLRSASSKNGEFRTVRKALQFFGCNFFNDPPVDLESGKSNASSAEQFRPHNSKPEERLNIPCNADGKTNSQASTEENTETSISRPIQSKTQEIMNRTGDSEKIATPTAENGPMFALNRQDIPKVTLTTARPSVRFTAATKDQSEKNEIEEIYNKRTSARNAEPGPKHGEAPDRSLLQQRVMIEYFTACIFYVLYSGLHAVAWNSAFESWAVKWAWRGSCLVVGIVPVAVLIFSGLWILMRFFGDPKIYNETAFKLSQKIAGYTLVVVYLVASLTLLVLCFITLRSLPPGTHNRVLWSSYIPHI